MPPARKPRTTKAASTKTRSKKAAPKAALTQAELPLAKSEAEVKPNAKAREVFDALIWYDPGQGYMAREVAELAGLRTIEVGITGEAIDERDEPALFGEARRITDIRSAIATTDAKVVWLTSAGVHGREASPLEDQELLRAAAERGVRVCTLEPAPESAVDLGQRNCMWARTTPMLVEAPVFAELRECLPEIGPIRAVHVSGRSTTACGSLGARLFDAMATVHALLGAADRIDASIVSPGATRGVYRPPSTALRAAQGDLSAHLRFSNGKSATVNVTNHAGAWQRGVTVLGDLACARVTDHRVDLVFADGHVEDRHEGAVRSAESSDSGVVRIADQLRRAIDPRSPELPPMDAKAILAMCEAAILSARTGEAEHPSTLLLMAGVKRR
ncbi:MAG: hypothetical protein KDA20_07060 [Phycisphaerales bacterium]|nr:hypothetical protein [Phycisphaerales bacterium]